MYYQFNFEKGLRERPFNTCSILTESWSTRQSGLTHFIYLFLGFALGLLMLGCMDTPLEQRVSVVAAVPDFMADGFDFPVGAPYAKGYYNAQPFGKNDHLGDDWNGVGGGNSDLGDTVYAAANGVCTEAINYYGGWGKVAKIKHVLGTEKTESLYGHLQDMWVHVGDTILRGQPIGSIGDAEGIYLAHLHFEIRTQWGMELGGGYSANKIGYVDPTAHVKAHRPSRK